MTETDEIAAWLREQAEADIEAAGEATPGEWAALDGGVMAIHEEGQWPVASTDSMRDRQDRVHIARHDPQTEAARAQSVLAVLRLYDVAVTVAEAKAGPAKSAEILRLVVRDLAAGYRHREGFKESWRE